MLSLFRSLVACLAVAGLSPPMVGQQHMKAGTVELTASGGGLFDLPGATAYEGICQTGTTNCHSQLRPGKPLIPLVEGEVAVSLSRFFWLYGDYNYVFPDRQSATASLGTITGNDTVNRHYWTATGGIELSFPTVHGLVPLLRLGGGEVHQSYNSYDVAPNTSAPIIRLTEARTMPAAVLGGGVRWYLGERQGIRVMANGYYLGHSVYDLEPSSLTVGGAALITRRSGGSITVGYFRQFGR